MTSNDQVAHASLEDVPTRSCADNGFGFQRGTSEMETSRKNAAIIERKLEAEAATKIQAGFRGYKVRKELKTKNGTIKTKRSLRRKSSGKLTEGGKIIKKDDLEERSATKIQAGIRGFLVRKKQMKNKKENQSP